MTMNTMNITSAQYVNSAMTGQPSSIKATIDGTEWSFPLDPANRHYAAILEQGIQIEAYVEPPITADQVRAERDALLAVTDWMALSDVTMSPEWTAYRQALRDVTDQSGFPENVDWPVKPE